MGIHAGSHYRLTSIHATIMVTTQQEYGIVGSESGEAKKREAAQIQIHC